ncbi:MAG: hypothetical protein JSR86_08370 [Proteobacteria bacterium]|nr:hypothetical protein [Pseudomonadota bacterium]
MRVSALFMAAMAGVCMAAGAANAADTAYALHEGTPNSLPVSVNVRASVGVVCGFATGAAPSGSYNASDIPSGFSHDFAFSLNCATPLRVAVVSSHGGMLAPGVPTPTGYTNLAPYNVGLTLVGDSGVTTVTSSCAAATLSSGGACSFVGPSSTSQGLKLNGAAHGVGGSKLTVSAPAYAGANILVSASTYSDTLTVTMSASP